MPNRRHGTTNKKRITITITDEFLTILNDLADKEQRSVSFLIDLAVRKDLQSRGLVEPDED